MIDPAAVAAETRESNELCSIHHVRMLKYGSVSACPECVEEMKIAQHNRDFRNLQLNKFREGSRVDDTDMFNCTFDNFKANAGSQEEKMKHWALSVAKAFMDKNKKHTALLMGNPGTGKTHLAMSILDYVNRNSDPHQVCRAVSINELMKRIKNSWHDDTELWTEEEAVRLMSSKETDLLLIDDLGTEASMRSSTNEASDWIQRIVYDVLNHQKRVIVTSNYSMQQLEQVYNPKIVSRLKRDSKGTLKNFEGISDKRVNGI